MWSMSNEQIIAMWASNILLDYAKHRGIQDSELPVFADKYKVASFLIDNYDLFHLYPDDAVFDEIDLESKLVSHD